MGVDSGPNVGSRPNSESNDVDAHRWPVSAFVSTLCLVTALIVMLVVWLVTAKTRGVTVNANDVASVAQWVQGIGTLVAVFAAMYVFSKEQRHTRQALKNGFESLEVSRQSLGLQLESRDMEQAAKVAAWVSCRVCGERQDPLWGPADDRLEQIWTAGQHDLRVRMGSEELGSTGSLERSSVASEFADLLRRFGDVGPANSAWIVLTCQNLSSQPIFSVQIEIVGDTAGPVACSFSWAMWSPERPVFYERVVPYDGDCFVLNLQEAISLSRSWRARIRFTDSASRRWLRTEEGLLVLDSKSVGLQKGLA